MTPLLEESGSVRGPGRRSDATPTAAQPGGDHLADRHRLLDFRPVVRRRADAVVSVSTVTPTLAASASHCDRRSPAPSPDLRPRVSAAAWRRIAPLLSRSGHDLHGRRSRRGDVGRRAHPHARSDSSTPLGRRHRRIASPTALQPRRYFDVSPECRSGYHAWSDLVETMGIEPTTPCLQSRCSSQLSYVPEGMSPERNRSTIPGERPARSAP